VRDCECEHSFESGTDLRCVVTTFPKWNNE
jgi:hypothetical protein